ncbi:hypothetical protein [Butyrivibrio sp. AE2032]|uniref:hypothetical protein n=1 Tax=Butyrivibrio sp. AE2032 TaxID=1458463 RepID=UPI000555B9AE|nr:hypothetical protein [Butyrivibrio sp. AE2032]
MDKKTIGKIQLIVTIAVVAYIVMPDLFAGPLDDTAIAALAAISEVVLGIARALAPDSDQLVIEANDDSY